jgi:uncharacterized membrane protein (UPF0182 family)
MMQLREPGLPFGRVSVNMSRRVWISLGIVVLLVLIFGGALARLYTDWLWFGETGYRAIFWTKLATRAKLGLAAGLLFFVIVYSNLWLAQRLAPPVLDRYQQETNRMRLGQLARRGFALLILGLALAASVLVGLETATHWMSYLTFTNATSFNQTDPIFGRDIGFYVFELGFLRYIYGWLLFTFIVAALATAAVHYTDRAIEFLAGMPTFAPHVKAHLSLLFAGALFVKAWGYRLDAFNLLYSPSGVVFGAGYTDVHARLIALKVLSIVAIIAGILALINIYRRGIALPAAAFIILVGTSFILGVLYPAFVQKVYVEPNEIARETKFISNNIQATRRAFNLHGIEERQFPASMTLTAKDIENNRATIKSIRVWDHRPLDKTYTQLQALWQYYDISNIDVDRYVINNELRQVMLAARELSYEAVRLGAGTWVNQHFQYTHGYGAVMSPVNRATREGLPEFFVEDIPPTSSVGIDIRLPQIYFGETTSEYVIVNSQQKEFDYPSAGEPKYTTYAGKGGIPVGSSLPKIAFAWRFGDAKLLLPNPITSRSRLMFRREIRERVETLLPFLLFDPDPYLVIADGKLYWMWDAYTYSRRYPYSTPQEFQGGFGLNYMRNAVKLVIDAYEGTVDCYVFDDTDPLLITYAKIFPGIFKPMSRMPSSLRAHIRYPQLLFETQSHVLLKYHVIAPKVLYAKNDWWDIPREIVETSSEQTPVEPYYMVMKLPGETREELREEFLLMLPFTPVNKDNMIAWMAARCGPEDYGKIVLFSFPKEQLIFGPAQIESRINQDSTISEQLTLWGQIGSRVNRGNQLVIPIEKSILYVKPLYLESETSKIPELKRVIVAYGSEIAMEQTLEQALARVFGGGAPAPEAAAPTTAAPRPPSAAPAAGTTRQLIDRAVSQFERAQELQRKGDWAGYGEEVRRLEQTLKQLQAQSGRQ